MITIREIAELAGTSRGTVDRVLKGRGGAAKETAERIEQICREHAYVPNRAGVLLGLSKKTFKVGVILPSLDNSLFEGVIQGLERAEAEFSDFGVRLELFELGADESEQLAAAERLERGGMQALIVAPVPSEAVARRLAALRERKIEVLTLGPDSFGAAPNVFCDSEKGGRLLGELLSLCPSREGALGEKAFGLAAEGICVGREENFESKELTCVGAVSGRNRSFGGPERFFHLLESVKSFPQISLRRIVECGETEDETVEKVSKMLRKYPEITLLFVSAEALPAVLRAVGDSKVEIIATECSDEVEDALKLGRVRFALSERGEEQGRLAVKLLVEAGSGRHIPARSEITPVILGKFSF